VRPLFLDNSSLAELLALEGERATGHMQRALKRAARLAFVWPQEAAILFSENRPLTQLPGIGPYLAKQLAHWISTSPQIPEPPEFRRGFLTLAKARHILAQHPLWLGEVKCDLQMHTTWSDGAASIVAMGEASKTLGYRYVAITDHSRGLRIAGGMDEPKLRRQVQEIDQVNRQFDGEFHVLRSIEMNLNPNGEGDMSSDSLAGLDLVLGSFHSALRRTEDQTNRYLAAIRNPALHILGHPRGRIYNFRPGLKADWAKVFELAAHLDKAVEIDAFPDRQDLDIDLLRVARKTGVRISLGTDAHQPQQLAFMELALAAAIEAEIPRAKILNFMPLEDLMAWAKNH
jgi:histidinol phosphatase-like PHP family hydrolase